MWSIREEPKPGLQRTEVEILRVRRLTMIVDRGKRCLVELWAGVRDWAKKPVYKKLQKSWQLYCPFLPPQFRSKSEIPEPHHSFGITKHLPNPWAKRLLFTSNYQVLEFYIMPLAFFSWIKYHQRMFRVAEGQGWEEGGHPSPIPSS